MRTLILGGLLLTSTAHAGGLFLPGSGAISTSRAGAAVASVDDGEALSLNPAGLAKTHGGWTLTISTSLIQYRMQFTRTGGYDPTTDLAGYEGTDYGTVVNKPKPPLGIGEFQPIPVIAIVTGLGNRIPGLRLALGLYAPNAYPFRDMSQGYDHNVTDPSTPPPPSRYDIMYQESQLLLPSVAAAYRVLPQLDIGARFTAGRAKAKSRLHLWGTPGNVSEWVKQDTEFTAEVEDSFVPGVRRWHRVAAVAAHRGRRELLVGGGDSRPRDGDQHPRTRGEARWRPVDDRPARRGHREVRDRRHARGAEGLHFAPAAAERDRRCTLQVARLRGPDGR
jgi:hypothetical protein